MAGDRVHLVEPHKVSFTRRFLPGINPEGRVAIIILKGKENL